MIERISNFTPAIYKVEDVMTIEDCDKITQYIWNIKKENTNPKDVNRVPWSEDDNMPWCCIQDIDIKKIITAYKYKLAQLVFLCNNNTIVYPHFTDLVLWREGKFMDYHTDSGYAASGKDGREDPLCRIYTTVTYMNDSYNGGETLILNENKSMTHKATPKKGSVMIFPSVLSHSVNQISNGYRVTLPIWFTETKKYCE